jgi:type IX secretion system PorP/SprF family membrane protein
MKKFLLFVAALCWLVVELKAQDPQFTQYYTQPLYLNPGFTGSAPMHRLSLAHRIQWPNLPRVFTTTALAYDYNLDQLNSGFGLLFVHDRAGSGNLLSNNINGLYSYKMKLKDTWVLTTGLQFGYVGRNLDYSRLLFRDQIGFGHSGHTPGTTDPLIYNVEKAHYFDFGTGMLLYNKASWLGVSVHHLNQPNQSVLGVAEDRLPSKYSVHGGTRLPLYNGLLRKGKISNLAPSFIYKKQGAFQQLDLGMHFLYDPLMAGLSYRGMVVKDDFGRSKQDAVSFLFGLRLPGFDLGYSYDFTISSLGPSSGGAHEIALAYLFNTAESRKVKRKEKFIPCPAFMLE